MRIAVFLGLLAAAVAFFVFNPAPEIISGRATVTDGDSLEIGATRIRLHAVDAPEGGQSCDRNDTAWDCGADATAKLRELVDTRTITCTKTDTDSYGRTVATCSNGAVDLGGELVSAGLALAYREFGDDYVDLEEQARAAGRGLWAGDFTPPWDFRRNPPPAPPAPNERSAPNESGDCLIKGNINRERERIYHVPGSRSYDETVIDESRGERMFCSEQEARDAGWRAPRGR